MGGGGMAILYKPEFKIKKTSPKNGLNFRTFEYIYCSLPINKKETKLINLYRLPYSAKHPYTHKMFLVEFENLISSLSKLNIDFIIQGDFNINLLDLNNTYRNKFLKLIESF